MRQFIHRINGVSNKTSVNVVLPHYFVEELGITKGDFVKINKTDDRIIIKKILTEKEANSHKDRKDDLFSKGKSNPSITIPDKLICKEGSANMTVLSESLPT